MVHEMSCKRYDIHSFCYQKHFSFSKDTCVVSNNNIQKRGLETVEPGTGTGDFQNISIWKGNKVSDYHLGEATVSRDIYRYTAPGLPQDFPKIFEKNIKSAIPPVCAGDK
jgi:hypothetical protein